MFGKKKITPAGDVEPVEDHGSLADQVANLASLGARHRADADDKKRGMTLAEMDRFVHEALSQGCGDNTPVMCQVNITGGIKAVWTREEKTNA
jgi:hypothetical protein